MRKLLQGLRQFQDSHFPKRQELFERLANDQKPIVLFITCSDSRIIPSLITQTDVGDIFTIRNVGNIIPPYGSSNGGEGAAIEYAIQALGIDQVIVCGHSNCGAMKGLLKIDYLEEEMPLVYEWLKHAESTRRLVKDNYQHCGGEDLLGITTAEKRSLFTLAKSAEVANPFFLAISSTKDAIVLPFPSILSSSSSSIRYAR